jgi:hypothetical protein
MTREEKRVAILAACAAFGEALCEVLADGAEDESPAPKRVRTAQRRPAGRVTLTEMDIAAGRELARRLGLDVKG